MGRVAAELERWADSLSSSGTPQYAPGVLVVDATFLRHLERADSAERLRRVRRAAHLRVYPSSINVIEALKHTNGSVRERLLDTLQNWQGDHPLLPWPQNVLKLAGEAALRGETSFVIQGSELEVVFRKRDALDEDYRKATKFVAESEARFRALHDGVRSEVQAAVRHFGLRESWPTAREFLESEWRKPDNLAHFAGVLWEGLQMNGEPPVPALLRSEPWRLAMDAFGTAVYDRVARPEQRRNPPSQLDLLQLVYLSLHRRSRILVTDDKSLREAASAMLAGAYPNARVMSAAELLAA